MLAFFLDGNVEKPYVGIVNPVRLRLWVESRGTLDAIP